MPYLDAKELPAWDRPPAVLRQTLRGRHADAHTRDASGGKRNPDGQGFAAFGWVVKGMDVVRKIQAAPAEGQALTPLVKILKVRSRP